MDRESKRATKILDTRPRPYGNSAAKIPAMNLSPVTRLVLVVDHRPPTRDAGSRRYRVARLDLRPPAGDERFAHLRRVYD